MSAASKTLNIPGVVPNSTGRAERVAARTYLIPGLGAAMRQLRGAYRQEAFAQELAIGIRMFREIERQSTVSVDNWNKLAAKFPELSFLNPPNTSSAESASATTKGEMSNALPLTALNASTQSPYLLVTKLLLHETRNASPEVIESLLFEQVNVLQSKYRTFGNPVLLYNAGQNVLTEFEAILSIPSFASGQLHMFLGKLLLNANINLESTQLAETHLRKAVQILSGFEPLSGKSITGYLSANLLLSISAKMQGRLDEAFDIISCTLKEKCIQKIASPLETLPLVRQKAIMEQTSSSHAMLQAALDSSEHSPTEHFCSFKRLFEFSLNTHNPLTMDQLYERTNRAFSKASVNLDPISKVSYFKNVYHYHRVCGRRSLADSLFKFVVQESRRLDLHGQHRQITRLKAQFDSESRGNKAVRLPVSIFTKA